MGSSLFFALTCSPISRNDEFMSLTDFQNGACFLFFGSSFAGDDLAAFKMPATASLELVSSRSPFGFAAAAWLGSATGPRTNTAVKSAVIHETRLCMPSLLIGIERTDRAV